MTTQEERLAHNEATFRDANEGIHATLEQHEFDGDVAPFICECSDADCRALVRVPLAKYREVRAVATRFLLASGHEEKTGAGSTLVEKTDGYSVVEKHGEAGSVATERAGSQ